MRLTRGQLRSLIRSNLLSERRISHKSLLLEEIWGAQAIVYHGTRANPLALIDDLLKDKFRAGEGAGDSYGKGLYTVYHLPGTQTESGGYGPHILKLKVNLYGYIVFDPFVASTVYGEMLTPAEQAEKVGYSEDVVKVLKKIRSPDEVEFTSRLAASVQKVIQYEVKGIVFTGKGDGRVVVVYDPTTAVPMAWKRVGSESWTPVDRSALLEPLERPGVSSREGRPVKQSALARSALGDFEAGKWDTAGSVLKMLKGLERLPEDQRVVDGDLDLRGTQITSLPAGLKVSGTLYLIDTPITSLPVGLKVGGLSIYKTQITSLPVGLKVNGDLGLEYTKINSLPADLQVGGRLSISGKSITSLPADLQVGGGLYLYNTKITSLPAGLQVGRDVHLERTPITSLPTDLQVGSDLYLAGTQITSLPAGLQVGRDVHLARTQITSLPDDLQLGGFIYGLNRKYWNSVPEHLKSKLQ